MATLDYPDSQRHRAKRGQHVLLTARFWLVTACAFAVLLPALLFAGAALLFSAGMAGGGPGPRFPAWFEVVAWLLCTPLRPMKIEPTPNPAANFCIAIGGNALLWSCLLALTIAVSVKLFARTISRARERRITPRCSGPAATVSS